MPGRTRTPLSWDGGVWRAATYRLASLGVLLRSPCPPCSPPPTKAGLPGPSAPRLALGDLSVLGLGAPLCRPRSGQGLNTPRLLGRIWAHTAAPLMFVTCQWLLRSPCLQGGTVPGFCSQEGPRGGPASSWAAGVTGPHPRDPPIRPGSRTAQDSEFWPDAGAGGCARVLLAPGLGDSGTELRALRG